jgi:hypothetical protein
MSYDVLLHPDADAYLREDPNEVRVTEILPIDEAHKRYGY